MKARRFTTWLLLLLAPLALCFSVLGIASAAPSHDMAGMSQMPGCHEPAGPQPAKAPICATDCPLVCATVTPNRTTFDAPIRRYARLSYDLAVAGLEGRALQPELPPPRSAQA